MKIFEVHNTDLQMKTLSHQVQALPGGGVLVVASSHGRKDHKNHVLRLDSTGSVEQTLKVTTQNINGFILMESDVLLLYDKSITRVRVRDGEVVNRYKMRGVRGSLMSGLVLDEDNLLLLDGGNLMASDGHVFTYSLNHSHTEDKVNNLSYPQSLAKIQTTKDTLFAICECGSNRVNLYNSKWRLQTSITETPDGPLSHPTCVVELPSEPVSILIADNDNYRVSQFTTEGRFIKHLIQGEENIKYPNTLSYWHSYIYVSCGLPILGGFNIKCFKLNR